MWWSEPVPGRKFRSLTQAPRSRTSRLPSGANCKSTGRAKPVAHVVDEDPAGLRLDGEGERVAQAEGPDGSVLAARGLEEGIVGGDGAVGIEPKHLAEQRIHPLRRRPGRLLAECRVQGAIRPE